MILKIGSSVLLPLAQNKHGTVQNKTERSIDGFIRDHTKCLTYVHSVVATPFPHFCEYRDWH